MRLIAIANISNGKNTLGFRLLDIDIKQIKDVPLENIKDVLKHNQIQIDNLTIKDGEVIGYNGSIERLPKLINGQLVGKSPLIVIDQLGNTGYTVSDFKGHILNIKTKDVVDYAKVQGISNGKVVNKDGTEFISAIDGQYNSTSTTEAKSENKKVDTTITKKENYTGELITEMRALSPVLISDREKNRENTIPNYVILTYTNDGIGITKNADIIFNITRGFSLNGLS